MNNDNSIHCPGCMAYRPLECWDQLPMVWSFTHAGDSQLTPTCDLCRSQGVWAIGHTTNEEYPCGLDVEAPVPRYGPEWDIKVNLFVLGTALCKVPRWHAKLD